jgi:RNA polymerase sigma factor (sigma-70 family)
MNAMLRENKKLIFAVMRAQVYGAADLDDLVQEGWIGLWRAIKSYDPTRGARFSTFAWLVIRQRIWKAVQQAARVERWREAKGPYTEAVDTQVIAAWQEAQIHEALVEGLAELNERERQVLLLRYGWDGRPAQTFSEISQTVGWTRQRMQQIHNEALSLLRAPGLSIRLRGICQINNRGDYRQALRQNREWQRTFRGRK